MLKLLTASLLVALYSPCGTKAMFNGSSGGSATFVSSERKSFSSANSGPVDCVSEIFDDHEKFPQELKTLLEGDRGVNLNIFVIIRTECDKKVRLEASLTPDKFDSMLNKIFNCVREQSYKYLDPVDYVNNYHYSTQLKEVLIPFLSGRYKDLYTKRYGVGVGPKIESLLDHHRPKIKSSCDRRIDLQYLLEHHRPIFNPEYEYTTKSGKIVPIKKFVIIPGGLINKEYFDEEEGWRIVWKLFKDVKIVNIDESGLMCFAPRLVGMNVEKSGLTREQIEKLRKVLAEYPNPLDWEVWELPEEYAGIDKNVESNLTCLAKYQDEILAFGSSR